MKLLLLRPRYGSTDFAEQVQAEGVTLFHHPVMSIAPLNNDNIEQTLSRFTLFDGAIFVSRTAALLTLTHMQALGVIWPEHLSVYAVGKSTAAILAREGVAVEVPRGEMTSEGLLALPALADVAGKRLVICCGAGGRRLLGDELCQRGAEVQRCELYRREPDTAEKDAIVATLTESQPEMLVVHSGELLENLLSLLPESLHDRLFSLPVLLPSQRVAAMAKKAGFQQTVTARSATADDMVSALREWYSSERV